MPEIFSAGDLISNPGQFAEFDPPVRLAVIGDPICHSRSPVFQNAALRACGISIGYTRLHVKPADFSEAVRSLPGAGFLGVNVTIPHKAAAFQSVDVADDFARACGSVNTIKVDDGKFVGFNTDGPGMARAIYDEFGVNLHDLRIVVLGAGGGAGRAIAFQCAIDRCERLVLVNRTLEKARTLEMELAPYFQAHSSSSAGLRLVSVPFGDEALRSEIETADLVINATSVGMSRDDQPLIPSAWIKPHLLVYDAIYTGGTSRLLEDVAAAGARGANGLGMLLHQGALAFEIWFDQPAPIEEMRRSLHLQL